MVTEVLWGVLLPFFGTSLGAACVFFLHKLPGDGLQRVLLGFAAGVMAAASVWSLLIPAIDRAAGHMGVSPGGGGAVAGRAAAVPDGQKSAHTLTLAVTLHNVPEGMAVGAAYAGCLAAGGDLAPALTLALAIGIQNVPEGAVISLPLRAEGRPKPRAFAAGVLSGAVEPLGAALTIAAAQLIVPALPYLLGFAAGAMLYVVAVELLPTAARGGALSAAVGFTVMMVLDVALG